jgi:two-component system sensor histidine kinase HydH
VSEGAWARWGLLASAFALGGVLILASWSNYRSAHAATTTLYVGQAQILEREIMSRLRRSAESDPLESPQAALDSLLAAQSEAGLRYVALFAEQGSMEASAGASLPGAFETPVEPGGEERGFRMSKIGSRVRMSLGRPPMGGMPPPPGGEPGRPRGRRHGLIVFEFEPVVAIRLMDRAARLLAFGLAAAVVMMLVAAVSHVASCRYESAKGVVEEKRRLSLVGEMSAVLAHEIRNPLASLKGHAQLLAEHLPDASADRVKADRVVHEASRLEALTSDLLDFVRTGPLDRVPIDPAGLVRLAVEEVEPDGFVLHLEDAPERWPLDGARIRQVLTNLLRNARQATPPDAPRPEVAMRVEDGRLVTTIRDHGEGVPSGQEDRIFDPFFTTRASGTGLGLAVARRIVELHGGEISLVRHPEGGAVFRIALPDAMG